MGCRKRRRCRKKRPRTCGPCGGGGCKPKPEKEEKIEQEEKIETGGGGTACPPVVVVCYPNCCHPGSTTTGQSGYVIPGQSGYVIPGQSGYVIPGQSGYVIPGQSGYVIPGQSGYVIPGQSGYVIPGQSGYLTQQISSLTCSISTVGIWLVSEQVSASTYLTGIGTNQISCGIPISQGNPCSYYFEGITTTSISLDASYFTLGTFVHYNYPVTGSISSVTLQLTVNINGVNANFCFEFRLNKALYQQGVSQVSPQTPGVSQSPPDIVSIPNTQSKETVIIDGKQYVLSLSGFFQNNQIESGFTSFANQVNVAQLLGKFVEVKSSVSELSSQNLGVR